MPEATRRCVASTTVQVPVRIADVGGWSDTWFAGSGAVCHLGVGPGVTVDAEVREGPPTPRPVRIVAPDIDADVRCGPSPGKGWAAPVPARHPLLEHAVAAVASTHPTPGPITVHVRSAVPPGASLGTSAAVIVGVIAAMERVLGATPDDADEAMRSSVASLAHTVETDAAGREAGVQDHWAAAFGGAQLLEIDSYPEVARRPLRADAGVEGAVAELVVTVALGAHDSSAIHAAVIDAVAARDREARSALDALAAAAHDAAAALERVDLAGWAEVLIRATDTQRRLHPALVGPAHTRAITDARDHGAIGWKVNGAGGAGGSVSVVFASPGDAQAFAAHVAAHRPGWTICPMHLAPGITPVDEVRG